MLSWVSITCGALTGIAGALTVSPGPGTMLFVATGILGVGTATVNTIRETVLPPSLEAKLWEHRNSTSELQDRFGDLFVLAASSDASLDELAERLEAAAAELRKVEATSLANRLKPEDTQNARLDFRNNLRFTSTSLVNEVEAPTAAEQPEAPDLTGMTRAVRGGIA